MIAQGFESFEGFCIARSMGLIRMENHPSFLSRNCLRPRKRDFTVIMRRTAAAQLRSHVFDSYDFIEGLWN